ncbi:MAG: hypothetical protein JSU71_11415, partial [Betaproteobacteria bacterium]
MEVVLPRLDDDFLSRVDVPSGETIGTTSVSEDDDNDSPCGLSPNDLAALSDCANHKTSIDHIVRSWLLHLSEQVRIRLAHLERFRSTLELDDQ